MLRIFVIIFSMSLQNITSPTFLSQMSVPIIPACWTTYEERTELLTSEFQLPFTMIRGLDLGLCIRPIVTRVHSLISWALCRDVQAKDLALIKSSPNTDQFPEIRRAQLMYGNFCRTDSFADIPTQEEADKFCNEEVHNRRVYRARQKAQEKLLAALACLHGISIPPDLTVKIDEDPREL